jgi:pimeloyl-ACP methyl ester carboxylesterase
MNEAIETRELIVLDGMGAIVPGTYHKTHKNIPDLQTHGVERDRVGVLFLNGLLATRASNGDAAVYWADSFAQHGYPSFRIDLPGYGDSEEDPPPEWLNFINQGGYASIVSAKIRELVARFNLSGVVMAGHCAGAVSAVYAAAAGRECQGLILMDPYFHFQQTNRTQIRKQLNLWALQSPLGRFLSTIYDLLKEIRLTFRRNVAPENANVPLLRCWKDLASTGLPILILKAPVRKTPGMKPRVGEFDYLSHALRLAGRRSRVVVKVTDGANHSFANHLGREAVRMHAQHWLDECFPLDTCNGSSVSSLRPTPIDSAHEYENREQRQKVTIPRGKVRINANDCSI